MILAIIQARMGSTRFPGKVLAESGGKSLLEWVIDSAVKSRCDRYVIATPGNAEDLALNRLGAFSWNSLLDNGKNDVLGRFYHVTEMAVAQGHRIKHIVRLSADCPCVTANCIDRLIETHVTGAYDYTHMGRAPHIWPDETGAAMGWPNGTGAEMMTCDALVDAHKHATSCYDREHVTPYFYKTMPDKYKIGFSSFPNLMIDHPEDLARVDIAKVRELICSIL